MTFYIKVKRRERKGMVERGRKEKPRVKSEGHFISHVTHFNLSTSL